MKILNTNSPIIFSARRYGWIDCFQKAKEMGYAPSPHTYKKLPKYLEQYDLVQKEGTFDYLNDPDLEEAIREYYH